MPHKPLYQFDLVQIFGKFHVSFNHWVQMNYTCDEIVRILNSKKVSNVQNGNIQANEENDGNVSG